MSETPPNLDEVVQISMDELNNEAVTYELRAERPPSPTRTNETRDNTGDNSENTDTEHKQGKKRPWSPDAGHGQDDQASRSVWQQSMVLSLRLPLLERN
jgi:hypothetical protein